MFWIKKLVSQLVMPIPLTLLLMLATLLFWRRIGKRILATAIVLLAALSSNGVSNLLAGELEHQYQVNSDPIVGSCVVMSLGNGLDDTLQGPASMKLATTGLARVVEAVRQFNLGENCLLVTSGWAGEATGIAYADVAADAAIELGVPADRIIRLTLPRDTIEEALAMKLEVADAPFRLVTSASHMPRAMMIFEHNGLSPIAAPTDFTARDSHWWVLSADNLLVSQRAIHEWLGQAWFKFRYG